MATTSCLPFSSRGVHSHTYSIYTQSEGTWAVTSVSDAYCAYPPLAVLDRWLIKDA